ncbi:MAG: hypothetical protein ABIN58_01525 [candidate division WOR-3 bacterium]
MGTGLLTFVLVAWLAGALSLTTPLRHGVLSVPVSTHVLFQIVPYAIWAAHPEYTLIENGLRIARIVRGNSPPPGSDYVAGSLAPTYAISGNFLSVAAAMYSDPAETYRLYRPSYVLAAESERARIEGEWGVSARWEPLITISTIPTCLDPDTAPPATLYRLCYEGRPNGE